MYSTPSRVGDSLRGSLVGNQQINVSIYEKHQKRKLSHSDAVLKIDV